VGHVVWKLQTKKATERPRNWWKNDIKMHLTWVPYHHGAAHSRVTAGECGLHIWKVAGTVDKGGPTA
jgi:hypothetical protein